MSIKIFLCSVQYFVKKKMFGCGGKTYRLITHKKILTSGGWASISLQCIKRKSVNTHPIVVKIYMSVNQNNVLIDSNKSAMRIYYVSWLVSHRKKIWRRNFRDAFEYRYHQFTLYSYTIFFFFGCCSKL